MEIARLIKLSIHLAESTLAQLAVVLGSTVVAMVEWWIQFGSLTVLHSRRSLLLQEV